MKKLLTLGLMLSSSFSLAAQPVSYNNQSDLLEQLPQKDLIISAAAPEPGIASPYAAQAPIPVKHKLHNHTKKAKKHCHLRQLHHKKKHKHVHKVKPAVTNQPTNAPSQ